MNATGISMVRRVCTLRSLRITSSYATMKGNYGSRFYTTEPRIVAPPLTFIRGEEMTRYAMDLMLEHWINPHLDTSSWEFYDLSCKSRDETNDQVLHDAVESGKRIGAIFKEPTITPTEVQRQEMGLSQPLGSPNGAMRRGWNGITISRDTIHIPGVELGFEKPVLFERHAVGGEYGAGFSQVGRGRLMTTFFPDDPKHPPTIVDSRTLDNDLNSVVTYHNPLDNVHDLAQHFFSRCLVANVVPYVVTKKTVFKWQEPFWEIMKGVFDRDFKDKYVEAGLFKENDELQHLISDAATMQIIRWTQGGFGMAAHNYDGDMLTDEVAQVHRSPGFITSNLIGKRDDGALIKEFEASHGTVADLWHMHLDGQETSFNPLGMAEAVIGAMNHAADLNPDSRAAINHYTTSLRKALHETFRTGHGTRDMAGPSGLTTEGFVEKVAENLDLNMHPTDDDTEFEQIFKPDRSFRRNYNVDKEAVAKLFNRFDKDGNGLIDIEEFTKLLVKLNIAPEN